MRTLIKEYMILQALNLYAKRHKPAAMMKRSHTCSSDPTEVLDPEPALRYAMKHTGANDTFSRLPEDWGDPCAARYDRRCGDMNAGPTATCNIPVRQGTWPRLTNIEKNRTAAPINAFQQGLPDSRCGCFYDYYGGRIILPANAFVQVTRYHLFAILSVAKGNIGTICHLYEERSYDGKDCTE